jgi:PAS domain S-box-containing protein
LARINTHWLGSRVPSPFDLRYLYYGLALVGATVAAAVLLLLWNRSLRRRVDEKTAELRAALGSVQEYASTVEDLYNHAPCGYHSVDADGVIVRVNDTELNWMGYTREEVVGKKHIFDFITPAGVEQYRELFPKFKELGSISNIEFELLRRDGSTMPLSVASTAVRDAQGRYVMSRTTLYDITERKRAEEALRRLNMELEQRVEERTAELATANKELEAFSYSLSHDLQAPLRAIDGFSAMLSENLGDGIDPEAKDCLNRLRAAGERMGVLIEEMLKLARISHANLHRTRVDLSAMAKDVLVEFRHAEPARKVEVDIAPNIEAFADAGLLRIALQNLLGNAWKYSSRQADARIEFGVLQQAEEPVYFVRDNGVGFDMDSAGKLFAPFRRLHPRSQFPGSGIGLATVQRIVNVHKGRIWAESEPGKGARFFFTLGAVMNPGEYLPDSRGW